MKRKVNINRPQISADEISKRRNFDSVLKQQAGISAKPLLKKPWFLSGVVIATVALVTALVFLNKDPKKDSSLTNDLQPITNADSIALAEFYKNEEAKPCIAPPIDGLNVEYTTYKVSAEKGGILDFKTGSKLSIPKNVFVDANGKQLKGNVELRYREFHDPVDFFVSGIPMTYDSGGTRYHFESAGMIEILAFQDGKKVDMAPEKTINIEMASDYKGTEYNLYKLDTLKNNWSCLGKDKVVARAAGPGIQKTDTTAFPALQETAAYKRVETKKAVIQKEIEVKIAALPKIDSAPQKPAKSRTGKFTFNIEVDAKEYPELTIYKGLLFEVGDENKNFSKELYDITWDEASVKEGSKKGENYILTLKKAKKEYNFVVYPVFEGKNYETALKDFQDKFKKYEVVLEKRKTDEKKVEAAYYSKLAAIKEEQKELELKWKAEQDERFREMNTEDKVKRMFAINSFGVFNCDNPSVYPQGVSCSANLVAEKDKSLRCFGVYLVDKKRNGIFTFQRNPVTNFSFDPKSTNMLWTTANGVMYWLKPEDFNSFKNGDGMQNVKLTRVDQKFAGVDELKAYLNF